LNELTIEADFSDGQNDTKRVAKLVNMTPDEKYESILTIEKQLNLKVEELIRWKHNRILIAEDEEFCIVPLVSMLNRQGINTNHHVDLCINGQELVDTFFKSMKLGMKYSIVFLDFSMPVMDGISASKSLRQGLMDLHIPKEDQPIIIGITGHV